MIRWEVLGGACIMRWRLKDRLTESKSSELQPEDVKLAVSGHPSCRPHLHCTTPSVIGEDGGFFIRGEAGIGLQTWDICIQIYVKCLVF